MTDDPYLRTPGPWLEDEVIMLENSGEMPEVVLAESLHHLGPLPPLDEDILRAATVRGYLKIIARDLDHANLGRLAFRGLDRAEQNLTRLQYFLQRLGWPPPPEALPNLADRLAVFLKAEGVALAQGRAYAGATREQVQGVARLVGLDLSPFQEILTRLDTLPAPDFWGLRALRRLETPQGRAKRRQEADGKARLEVLDRQGRPLAVAELPLIAATDEEDPECRARVELVWSLVPLPEA